MMFTTEYGFIFSSTRTGKMTTLFENLKTINRDMSAVGVFYTPNIRYHKTRIFSDM